jgi:hypothetical protein
MAAARDWAASTPTTAYQAEFIYDNLMVAE